MTTVRLMDAPADYARLGVNPHRIEPWEDGRRENYRAGAFEWWYFDAICDDGTTIAAAFSTKFQIFTFLPGLRPDLTFHITTPDGKVHSEHFSRFPRSRVTIDQGTCNVQFGPHRFVGDLETYHVSAEAVRGTGFDVTLVKEGGSWRAGTGYFGFGDGDEKYFTWLCAVPKGKLTGTVTVDGQTRTITGYGYHDHQWGNLIHWNFVNNWLWARQNTDDYSIAVFDYVMNDRFGRKRVPLAFVQDRDGKFLFENTQGGQCEVLEEYYHQPAQTTFPKKTRYTFERDGKTMVYTLTMKEALEERDAYGEAPAILKFVFDRRRVHPKYGRYLAEGELVITEHGQQTTSVTGSVIYEFVYIGVDYRDRMDTRRASPSEPVGD